MMAYIRGVLQDIQEDGVVVECQGIGYSIAMASSALSQLPGIGQEVRLHTYMQVREDLVALFGFPTREDLALFRMMIGVSGIGPRGALGILSALSSEQVRMAIVTEDAKSISRAPGVGLKTAQKLILELKDKVAFPMPSRGVTASGTGKGNPGVPDAVQDVLLALESLGYGSTEALGALRGLSYPEDISTGALLKLALERLAE